MVEGMEAHILEGVNQETEAGEKEKIDGGEDLHHTKKEQHQHTAITKILTLIILSQSAQEMKSKFYLKQVVYYFTREERGEEAS